MKCYLLQIKKKHEELDCIVHYILELQKTGSIAGVLNNCITIVSNLLTTYRKVDSFLQSTVHKPYFVSMNNNEDCN